MENQNLKPSKTLNEIFAEFAEHYEGDKTLEAMQQFLIDNWDKGTNCPCCGQRVQLYKRNLNSGMVRGLITLYNITRKADVYIHTPTEFTKRKVNISDTEFSKMVYFGLVSAKANLKDPKKRCAGIWAITNLGVRFVTNNATVPKYVRVYDSKLYFKEGEVVPEVTVEEALGEKFNYSELMLNTI